MTGQLYVSHPIPQRHNPRLRSSLQNRRTSRRKNRHPPKRNKHNLSKLPRNRSLQRLNLHPRKPRRYCHGQRQLPRSKRMARKHKQ